MINTDDFIKRLEILLEYFGVSASVFADAIGVQRSGLSHLLSGRNKPSLDFVMKIVEQYPEVDLYWLLNGVGNFPPNDTATVKETDGTAAPVQKQVAAPPPTITPIAPDLFTSEYNEPTEALTPPAKGDIQLPDIERIVVFYSDGSFKHYVSRL